MLCGSASLVVRDVHCPLFHRSSDPEERSNAHAIALVPSGVFTVTTGGETLVADPNHVLFFTRHQPCHVAHPVAGGDTCTLLALRPSDLLDVVNATPQNSDRRT